jgi:hypothetical protein
MPEKIEKRHIESGSPKSPIPSKKSATVIVTQKKQRTPGGSPDVRCLKRLDFSSKYLASTQST